MSTVQDAANTAVESTEETNGGSGRGRASQVDWFEQKGVQKGSVANGDDTCKLYWKYREDAVDDDDLPQAKMATREYFKNDKEYKLFRLDFFRKRREEEEKRFEESMASLDAKIALEEKAVSVYEKYGDDTEKAENEVNFLKQLQALERMRKKMLEAGQDPDALVD